MAEQQRRRVSLLFGSVCTSSFRRLCAAFVLIVLAASELFAASDGNLVAGVNVTEPIALPTTITTAGAVVDLYDFDIVDPGGDGLGLTVSQIVVNTSGTASAAQFGKITWHIDGPDAVDVIGVYAANTITFSALTIALTDASADSYIISGHYNDNTGLTENATFILSIDGDTDLTVGGGGTLMGATTPVTNATGTITQVTATQLVFVTPPADAGVQDVSDEVMSAIAFATQPIAEAQDAGGNTDVNFNENITITKTVGAGTFAGTATKAAVSGVADFVGLGVTYTAASDGEAFTLQAADAGGGIDPTDATTALSADVVATTLVFSTPPSDGAVQDGADEVVNAQVFATQPTVTAQNGQPLTDTDFAEDITITKSVGTGSLSGATTKTAASGVADFSGLGLTYTVVTDGESFTLEADDAAGGIDPAAGSTTGLSADIITTQLVFATEPSPQSGRSGELLDFALDPVVEAQDDAGNVDEDFNDTVTLSETGAGSAVFANESAVAASGVATFTGLTITYTSSDPDGESFSLQADDTGAGLEGDLGSSATSAAIQSITLDFDGTLTAGSAVAEPVSLLTNSDEASTAVDIVDFVLTDGGSGDGVGMGVSEVVIHTSGDGPFEQITFRLDGPDVDNTQGAYDDGANTITFSGLNVSVADGDNETYRINAYLDDLSLFTDGSVMSLSLDGDVDVTLDPNGTQMSGSNAAVANGGTPVEFAAATVILSNLGPHDFDYATKTVAVTTLPANLPLTITYDGAGASPKMPGTYQVTVVVTNAVYKGSAAATLIILTPTQPVPQMTATPRSGQVPLTVHFVNELTGYIDFSSMETDNSDGQILFNWSERDVIYDKPGIYRPRLEVRGPGGVSSGTLTITVYEAPSLNGVPPQQAAEDEEIVLSLTDLDDSPGTWSVSELPETTLIATLVLSPQELRITPLPNRSGTETIELVRSNVHGLQTSLQVRLTWTAVDDPPQIAASLGTMVEAVEDQPIQLDALATDVDTELGGLIWEASGFDRALITSFSAEAGKLVFVPAAEGAGETEVTLTVQDPATGATDSQQVTLRWTVVNDSPEPARAVFPPDGATDVSFTPTLVWEPQIVDNLPATFDIWFGPVSGVLELKAESIGAQATWSPGLLLPSMQYEWKLVTRSVAGMESSSSMRFETMKLPTDATGEPIQGLFNGDAVVDLDDFFLFVDVWGASAGTTEYNPAFDLDGDGRIGFDDYFLFADSFGSVAIGL